MKLRRAWFILWLAAILFPAAWLRGSFWQFRYQFDAIFAPEWVHIVMHAIQYAVLVMLTGYVLGFKRGFFSLLLSAGIIIVVGVGQEVLQLITHSTVPGWNSLFDLGVDLAGGFAGYLFYFGSIFLFSRTTKKSKA